MVWDGCLSGKYRVLVLGALRFASLDFSFMGERVNVYVSLSLRRNLHAKMFATGKWGPIYINMRLCACLLKRNEFGGKLLSVRRVYYRLVSVISTQ